MIKTKKLLCLVLSLVLVCCSLSAVLVSADAKTMEEFMTYLQDTYPEFKTACETLCAAEGVDEAMLLQYAKDAKEALRESYTENSYTQASFKNAFQTELLAGLYIVMMRTEYEPLKTALLGNYYEESIMLAVDKVIPTGVLLDMYNNEYEDWVFSDYDLLELGFTTPTSSSRPATPGTIRPGTTDPDTTDPDTTDPDTTDPDTTEPVVVEETATVELPASEEGSDIVAVEVQDEAGSALAEVILPNSVIENIRTDAEETVELVVEKMSDNSLNIYLQTADGSKVTQLTEQAVVAVPAEEQAVKIALVDGEPVLFSAYDAESGKFVIETDVFGNVELADVTGRFDDVADSSWYAEAVNTLAAKNVINGVDERTFNPEASVTRAEFAKMIAGIAGADLTAAVSLPFTDCDASAWYAPALSWCYAQGLIQGLGDGTFGVNDYISRQDMAVIMARAIDVMGAELAADTTIEFADEAQIASYAKESIQLLVGIGVVNGKDDNRFEPAANLTRAEAAKVINTLLNKITLG